MWSAFFVLSIFPEICRNLLRFTEFWFYLKNINLNKILNISGNSDSTEKVDNIAEMPELGELFYYCKSKFDKQMPQIIYKIYKI